MADDRNVALMESCIRCLLKWTLLPITNCIDISFHCTWINIPEQLRISIASDASIVESNINKYFQKEIPVLIWSWSLLLSVTVYCQAVIFWNFLPDGLRMYSYVISFLLIYFHLVVIWWLWLQQRSWPKVPSNKQLYTSVLFIQCNSGIANLCLRAPWCFIVPARTVKQAADGEWMRPTATAYVWDRVKKYGNMLT
jgi:hypothetical protein